MNIEQAILDNPAFQADLQDAANRYDMFTSDAWRCDFCESGCNCDRQYLENLAIEIREKYNLLMDQDDEIENLIYDKI